MTPIDPIALATAIAQILDELRIPYVIGGSVASSIYGEPRSTLDLDIMIDADEKQVATLVARLRDDFHIDRDDALEAARLRTSFSGVQMATSMKIDFFLTEKESFAKDQMARRRSISVGSATARLHFYAPEDLIIRKLMWYRAGGEQSERQWRDVTGILRMSREQIDFDYLRQAATKVSVTGLIERLEKETQK